MVTGQHAQQRNRRRRNRTRGNSLLRSDDGNGHRAFRTNLRFACHFGDHRQYRIGHMAGSGYESKQVSHQRTEQRNPGRIAAQQFLRLPYHQVEPPGRLHTSCRRDDRYDHQHHIDRRRSRLQPEYESKDTQSDASHYTETDTAEACTEDDRDQNKKELQQHRRGG